MKFVAIILACSLITLPLLGQEKNGLSLSVSLGFGAENIQLESIYQGFSQFKEREIEYIKALTVGVGKPLNKNIQIGVDISYYWATLDYVPEYSLGGIPLEPSINQVNWISGGVWGKYLFFPDSRFNIGIMSSVGAHIGYPESMGISNLERHIKAYIAAHGGVEYNLSKRINVSYYIGIGKYKNIITAAYSFR
jgi:hypothetical protein